MLPMTRQLLEQLLQRVLMLSSPTPCRHSKRRQKLLKLLRYAGQKEAEKEKKRHEKKANKEKGEKQKRKKKKKQEKRGKKRGKKKKKHERKEMKMKGKERNNYAIGHDLSKAPR